ncbi:MAG: hypothetical protein AYL33_001940 [Candidatus Bathyarchaeota archaeon B63]|nr:MAG: hypothetical protein AYL33_001940 [Candidatus Bathyarchaeota archaeon B63]
MKNPWLHLNYDLESGSLDISHEDAAIRNAQIGLQIDGEWICLDGPADDWVETGFKDEVGDGWEITSLHRLGGVHVKPRIRLYRERPSVTLCLTIENNGEDSIRIGRVHALEVSTRRGGRLELGGMISSARIFLESNNLCWTGVRPISEAGGRHRSGGVGVIYNPAVKIAFLTGFLTVNVALGEIVTLYDHMSGIAGWWAENPYDDLVLRPGEALRTELLYIDFRRDPLDALETYGDMLAKMNNIRRIPRSRTPMLWCSWYSHRLTITEEAVLKHADIIAERFKEYGVDLLQIDFGWNWRDTPGEWRPHPERFPHGLRWLADRLKEKGLKLGLWIAPFYIGEQSSFYREHPECLLRNPSTGRAVEYRWAWSGQSRDTWQNVALMDTSKPESQRWLKETFKRLSSWGVSYFKLDFLNGGSAAPLAFAKPGAENEYRVREGEQMRIGLSAIREAVGRDAYLLGCNLPISHGLGLLSAIFGAEDVGNATGNFEHLKRRMTTLISRFWQQKRLWHVDPDVLYLGGRFLKPGEVSSIGEARIRATAVALSGGPVLLGDDLTTLPEERMRMYTLCLPPYGVPARPIDLFRSPYPSVWDLEVSADWDVWHVVGLFNFDGQERIIDLDFDELGLSSDGEYSVWEFWDQAFLGNHRGKIKVEVPGRTAMALAIRRLRRHPFVISTSFHITQGGVELQRVMWDERSLVLSGVCRRVRGAAGEIFIYIPPSYRLEEQREAEMLTGEIARLRLSIPSPEVKWKIRFSHS